MPTPRMAGPDRSQHRELSALARAWRLLALAVGAALLVTAQLLDSSEWFPLTSMAQFAQARDPEGTVVSTCLLGTVEGEAQPREIPFGTRSVGVQRSDVEGNLRAFREDPAMLAALAEDYARLHPGEPPLTSLSLCQEITHLHHGGPPGHVDRRILATWRAP